MLLTEFLSSGIASLEALYPTAEARSIMLMLCGHLLGTKSYTHILEPSTTIDGRKLPVLQESLDRLVKGEPIQYVIGLTEFCGLDFARPFYDAWWAEAARQGINEDNFASWLRDARTYPEMLAFLKQGAIERMWEFVDGHRLPKVVAIFLMGYLIGKHRLYARLEKRPLQRMLLWTSLPGVPGSPQVLPVRMVTALPPWL